MKSAVYKKAGQVGIEEVKRPSIQEADDVIIRVVRACVCGSDLWSYRNPDIKAGHKNSGQHIPQKQSKENTEQDSYHLLANKKFGTRVLQSKPEGIHLLKRKQHDKLILKYFPQDMGTI